MSKKEGHKLIFEGAELSGKSSIIHLVYDYLEKKYNTHRFILDGCHWFNSDVGIFGTKYGREVVGKYIEIAKIMREKNIIFEKLHISDQVYHQINSGLRIDYKDIEEKLLEMNVKIILCTVRNDQKIFEARLKDRLTLYSHYGRISRKPEDYLNIQKIYVEKTKKSKLPVFTVDLTDLPNPKAVKDILAWIGE